MLDTLQVIVGFFVGFAGSIWNWEVFELLLSGKKILDDCGGGEGQGVVDSVGGLRNVALY